MKKAWPLFLIVLGACAPDITENPAPSTDVVIAEFDPGNAAVPIVPAPNDLALDATTHKVVVPVPNGCPGSATPPSDNCGGTTGLACDAGKSCTIYEDCASGACVAGKCVGGCPSDAQQEFNKDYLGGLVGGFPYESTAQALFSAEVDPSTINPQTVLVVDVTSGAPVPVSDAVIIPAPTSVIIQPPPKLWTRGHHYAVAVLGGASGVKGKNGQPVIGSTTWALVQSANPLVTCNDLGSPDCKPAVDVIPSDKSDPGERLFDQTQKALQLEKLRQAYDPILKGFAGTGKNRDDIVLAWTFSIVDAAEVTFDPANNVLPFPNDLATDPTTHNVNLPNPHTGKPLAAADCAAPADQQVALVCGLNTLDGFSTTVGPISESSDTLGTLLGGDVDPKSLDAKSVGLVPIATKAPAGEKTAPSFTPCLNCLSSPKADGTPQTSPQQLQWKLNAPLDEKTTYAGFLTSAVKDTMGKNVVANPAFALFRSKASLLTSDKHSAVTILTDEQATQLEAARAAMSPVFDGLAMSGLQRASLTLGFAFTTQTEAHTLAQLITLPTQAKAAGLPDVPIALADVTAAVSAAATAAGAPHDKIGKFFAGEFLSPDLRTGIQGTFNPDPTKARPLPVQFTMAVPDKAQVPPPATGYSVTIFGHGLTRSRNDFIAIANALAGLGQVVIAADWVFHGDRSSCTGSKDVTAASLPMGVTPSDDFACKTPAAAGGNMTCDEDPIDGQCILTGGATRSTCVYGKFDAMGDAGCAAQGQGRCAADNKCQGTTGPLDCTAAFTGFGPDAANGQCLQAGLGLCVDSAAGGGAKICSGSQADLARDASGLPKISGWNTFSLTNFFATRDNFRQSSIDAAQLVNLIKSTTAAMPPLPANLGLDLQGLTASATPVIDGTKINYVGQSLGGIFGALFNAVSPDTTNVALNVPGGALSRLFLDSPTLAPQKMILVQTLAAAGVNIGTPAFDTFIGSVQWILDPADPANMGYRLTHAAMDVTGVTAPNPNRHTFIQFIQNDQFVINESNLALVAGANRMFDPMMPPKFNCQAPLFCYEFTEMGDGFDTTSLPLADRHGFLLNGKNVAVTTKAQTQVAVFINTGAVP